MLQLIGKLCGEKERLTGQKLRELISSKEGTTDT